MYSQNLFILLIKGIFYYFAYLGLETTHNEFTASVPHWQMTSLATPFTPHPKIPFKSLFETLSGIEI